MIRLEQLRVLKAGQTICEVPHLAIDVGERIAVVGPNGSGKSTLLRVLAGLERDYVGTCDIGVSLRQCVYVHQAPLLFSGTVLTNTTYGLAARGVPRRSCRTQAMDILAKLGIDRLAERDGASLSGGETRRVALARALVLQPEVLLLDEPFADLDETSHALVVAALAEATSTTVVLASPTRPVEVPHRLVTMAERGK